MEYIADEKIYIIEKYLNQYDIKHEESILDKIERKVDAVPREIHNLCIKIRDYVITQSDENKTNNLTNDMREGFLLHSKIDDG
jgi:hypothetical protein